MLEAAIFEVFSEVQCASNAATTGVRTRWQDYLALTQVKAENEQLKQQLGQLRVELQQERGLATQSQSLQQLLGLKTSIQVQTTAANVI